VVILIPGANINKKTILKQLLYNESYNTVDELLSIQVNRLNSYYAYRTARVILER